MNFLRRLRGLGRPRSLPSTAGMISKQEQAWIRDYAAELYRGRGAIVDLGCFVGSTTICLAQGLEHNREEAAAKIHAYDRFVWEEGFAEWWNEQNLPAPAIAGNFFLREFLNRTSPWSDRIILHVEDLEVARWDEGPIEFLMVDAMKTPELAQTIARTFFPSLIPGSYLAHQDFAHSVTHWIHVLQYRLRDCFTLAADIPRSASIVFRCIAQVTPETLATSLSSVSPEEMEAVFDYSLSLVSDDKKPSVIAAKALAWFERNDIARARRVIETNRWGSVSLGGELEAVTQLIQQKKRDE